MMKNLKFYFIAFVLASYLISGCNTNTENPIDKSVSEDSYTILSSIFTVDKENAIVNIRDLGDGFGGDYTMYADTTYVLNGLVFVNEGQTLTIEPGCMIQGTPGQGENASALIVAKGGKILAEGTSSLPIVFTGLGDNYEGTVYGKSVRGLWGGLIILGKAKTNNLVDQQIEGIPETETRGLYGGTDDSDNSGVLKYISIRHGGTDIGAGNEINGLSLGAVGSSTVIDYIEVFSNIDDGIEFFGGAAEVKHAVIVFCGDDSFDYDQGFHGKGQFWFTVQDEIAGDRCAEQDGGPSDNEAGAPYAIPTIYNATYISNGGKLMVYRDNAGGTYANSIFANASSGVKVEFRDDKGSSSYDMFIAGKLNLKNNIFVNVDDVISYYEEKGTAPYNAQDELDNYFVNSGNIQTQNIFQEGTYIPLSGMALNGLASDDSWFDEVSYQGAFDPSGTDWTNGWTLYSRSK